jgi:hypothetical protein
MPLLNDMVTDYSERFGKRLALPEYRQIEIYARKKRVPFALDRDNAPPAIGGMLGLCTAFLLLDGFCESRDIGLEGKPLWERYRALPRRSTTDKLMAEVYRILRIVRLTSLHAPDHIDMEDGLITLFCTYNRDALRLTITPLGLELLRSFVVYYLESFQQPYPEAYVEAMLMEYFVDILGEIKSFADEDRVLFQFRRKYHFSRTLRLDCDSPRFHSENGLIRFDIGENFVNGARYPIDIFVMIDEALHIIPIEALTDFCLPADALPTWKARGDAAALPASFHPRFGRTIQVPGQPMT